MRKSPEFRRAEILAAAKKVFLEKGYKTATMEDIVAKTSLSKGGVYRYYNSKRDMLHDLMVRGHEERFLKFRQPVDVDNLTLEAVVDFIYEKICDINEMKSIYSEFMLACKDDPELTKLRSELFSELTPPMARSFENWLGGAFQDFPLQELISLTDALIFSTEMLGSREVFTNNPDFIKSIYRSLLEEYRTNEQANS